MSELAIPFAGMAPVTSATRDDVLALSAGAETYITWPDNAEVDSDDMAATAPFTRLTVNTPGTYAITLQLGLEEIAEAPLGTVMLWAGLQSNIPSGWHECDGTNGTFDLRNQYLRGAVLPGSPSGTAAGTATHQHNSAGGFTVAAHGVSGELAPLAGQAGSGWRVFFPGTANQHAAVAAHQHAAANNTPQAVMMITIQKITSGLVLPRLYHQAENDTVLGQRGSTGMPAVSWVRQAQRGDYFRASVQSSLARDLNTAHIDAVRLA